MKVKFKGIMYVAAMVCTLLLQGCGGGTTTGNSAASGDSIANGGSGDPTANGGSGTTGADGYYRITIAGSSVTWGDGFMGNGDYVEPIENHYRENKAETIMPNTLNPNASVISDKLSYQGKLYKYNANSEIKGSIAGDKISIAFAAQRGSQDVVVEMIVDGKSLGEHKIQSDPVLHASKTFIGNGHLKSFDLGKAHTFNHTVSSGYGAGFMLQSWEDLIKPPLVAENDPSAYTVDFASKGKDWAIVRKAVNIEDGVHHFITFKNAPSGTFTVSYDFGENIKPVKSSVDNIGVAIGSDLEHTYGDRFVTDLNQNLKPTEGLDFRQNDERAVKTWVIGSGGAHDFTLKVKSGELLLNFITNNMYLFQNAGIGATSAGTLSAETGPARTTQQIRDFDPDLFIFESSTNDAITANKWVAQDVPYEKTAANKIRLTNATHLVKAGDVVVMGEYKGDIKNIVVGVVRDNSNNGTITFTTNVSDVTDKTCDIKSITTWENDVKSVIGKVTSNVNHEIKVGIATCGVPDLDKRRLMGYREKGMMMAKDNNWMFFDFFNKTLGQNWSDDNTHPNALGIELFGEAVIEVIEQQNL